MKETKEEKHKQQQDRIEYLSKKYGEKIEGLHKVEVENLNKFKQYLNREPSKEYIENLKAQGWYQVECKRCKISNRKWLDEENSAFEYPISRREIQTKRTVKVLYFCNKCNYSWEG